MATLTIIKPTFTATGASSGVSSGAGQACAAGGDLIPNDGKTILRYTNSGSSITVTVTPQVLPADPYRMVKTLTFVIPATTGDFLTPRFDPAIYNDGSGNIVVTYSAVTGLLCYPMSHGGA